MRWAPIWLALRRLLPWPLMGFLADAHQRGVLQPAGTAYQFRHTELQHQLATRTAKPADVPPEERSSCRCGSPS